MLRFNLAGFHICLNITDKFHFFLFIILQIGIRALWKSSADANSKRIKYKENTITDKLKALSVLGVTQASLVGPLGTVEDNSNGRQTWEAGLGETAQG